MESPERSLARRAVGKAVRTARDRYRSTVDRSALVDSDLFDHEWYSHCVGRPMERDEAVDHYLEHGRANQWTPNPLFDPDFFVEKNEEHVVGGQDPFVTYVRGRHWWAQVHPMVMIRRYNNDFPEALDYPTGPIGHYLDIGAARGHRINAWYDENDKSNPRGLADWIKRRVTEWHESRAGQVPLWGPAEPERRSEQPPASRRDIGRVSVLVAVRDAAALDETLASVLAQSYDDLEVIVAPMVGVVVPEQDDDRVRLISPSASEWAAFNAALEAATGSWVAPTLAGDHWLPARLDTIAASMDELLAVGARHRRGHHATTAGVVSSCARRTRQILECGGDPELSTVLCATALARAVGGFDERLEHAAGLGFVLKLAMDQPGTFVPSLGLRFSRQQRRAHVELAPSRRPWFTADEVPGYRDLALNDVLVDWRAAEDLEVDPELTTIIVPTYNDYTMTREAVWDVCFHARYDDTPVEIIVVDNGCPQLTSVVLASLEHSYAFASQVRRIKVLHSGPNLRVRPRQQPGAAARHWVRRGLPQQRHPGRPRLDPGHPR